MREASREGDLDTISQRTIIDAASFPPSSLVFPALAFREKGKVERFPGLRRSASLSQSDPLCFFLSARRRLRRDQEKERSLHDAVSYLAPCAKKKSKAESWPLKKKKTVPGVYVQLEKCPILGKIRLDFELKMVNFEVKNGRFLTVVT